jgi:hypothetical protein
MLAVSISSLPRRGLSTFQDRRHCVSHGMSFMPGIGLRPQRLTGNFQLPKLFWQFAHQHFRAKRYLEAADWYLLGTHDAFRSIAELSRDKCNRKAALCHIEVCDYSHATVIARRCAPESALTQYILLLVAVRQGMSTPGSVTNDI